MKRDLKYTQDLWGKGTQREPLQSPSPQLYDPTCLTLGQPWRDYQIKHQAYSKNDLYLFLLEDNLQFIHYLLNYWQNGQFVWTVFQPEWASIWSIKSVKAAAMVILEWIIAWQFPQIKQIFTNQILCSRHWDICQRSKRRKRNIINMVPSFT